jgi:hypothetical protein
MDALRRVKEANSKPPVAAATPASPEAHPEAPVVKETPSAEDPPLPPTYTEPDMFRPAGANPYDTPERRKVIEARCKDMSFDDLVIHGELRQHVPIRPGVLEVEFRSYSAGEELFLRGEIYDKGKDRGLNARDMNNASIAYMEMTMTLNNLTLAITKLNGKQLPSHLDDKGEVVSEKFYAKAKTIRGLPAVVVGDLTANWGWFQERLQKLVTADAIKNG